MKPTPLLTTMLFGWIGKLPMWLFLWLLLFGGLFYGMPPGPMWLYVGIALVLNCILAAIYGILMSWAPKGTPNPKLVANTSAFPPSYPKIASLIAWFAFVAFLIITIVISDQLIIPYIDHARFPGLLFAYNLNNMLIKGVIGLPVGLIVFSVVRIFSWACGPATWRSYMQYSGGVWSVLGSNLRAPAADLYQLVIGIFLFGVTIAYFLVAPPQGVFIFSDHITVGTPISSRTIENPDITSVKLDPYTFIRCLNHSCTTRATGVKFLVLTRNTAENIEFEDQSGPQVPDDGDIRPAYSAWQTQHIPIIAGPGLDLMHSIQFFDD